MLPRWSHSVVAVELAPGLTEVSVFGGSPLYEPGKALQDHHIIAETVIMTFGELIIALQLHITTGRGSILYKVQI